jgi:hypothetical protein
VTPVPSVTYVSGLDPGFVEATRPIRTDDLLITNQLGYGLSYGGMPELKRE